MEDLEIKKESKLHIFDCGCSFPILRENPLSLDFTPNIEEIPLDCKKTWALLSQGKTTACFQLESQLGKSTCKRLEPENMEHLAALVAIIRPSCLEAEIDGKNITSHYIDRKNGKEEVKHYHPALEKSLGETYSLIIYQESSLRIVQDIAGFDLQQADKLRRSIGHKDVDLMAKVEKEFLEGCKKEKIVNEEEAKEIFSWIKASENYAFNKSHSVSYAYNTYLTAFCKSHFPLQFYTACLEFAKDSSTGNRKVSDIIKELVADARLMNIEIRLPDLRRGNADFAIYDNKIYFGLLNIKGVGQAALTKLKNKIKEVEEKLGKTLDKMSWLEVLIFIIPYSNVATVRGFISCGALDHLGLARGFMIFEMNAYKTLSKKEKEWIENNLLILGQNSFSLAKKLYDILFCSSQRKPGRGQACSSVRRQKIVQDLVQTLKKNPYYIKSDGAGWIASTEESLLGVALSCDFFEECSREDSNLNCQDFNKGKGDQHIFIPIKIDSVRNTVIKRGRNVGAAMAILSVSDQSGMINSVPIFPDIWLKYINIVFQDNIVLLHGYRKDKSLIIENVYQIS